MGQSVQRYYDPAVGRFLSVDPVTASSINGGNFNRYWYGNNNPYKFTDPDGRKACPPGKSKDCIFGEYERAATPQRRSNPEANGAFTAEDRHERLAKANAMLNSRLESWSPPTLTTVLEAATEFARLTQDITTRFGVEFSAVLVDNGGYYSIENFGSGQRFGGAAYGNAWIEPRSAAPPGGLSYVDIHTHPVPGAYNDYWSNPFSGDDVRFYRANNVRGLVSLPDGSIYSIDPYERPEKLR